MIIGNSYGVQSHAESFNSSESGLAIEAILEDALEVDSDTIVGAFTSEANVRCRRTAGQGEEIGKIGLFP